MICYVTLKLCLMFCSQLLVVCVSADNTFALWTKCLLLN